MTYEEERTQVIDEMAGRLGSMRLAIAYFDQIEKMAQRKNMPDDVCAVLKKIDDALAELRKS